VLRLQVTWGIADWLGKSPGKESFHWPGRRFHTYGRIAHSG